jgi:hypothetical protein
VWNGKFWNENNLWKKDGNQKSFVFTLKNPNNIPAKIFALKTEEKNRTIDCNSTCGPCFDHGYDIAVSDNCNASTKSFTALGDFYNNDTELAKYIVFTELNNSSGKCCLTTIEH